MKRATSLATPTVHSARAVTHRALWSWTVVLLIATFVSWCATALATKPNDGPLMGLAQIRESLVDIEVESTRLGLVSAAAIQGDRGSFVDLDFASRIIQQESIKLDANKLEGQPFWTTHSNWPTLRKDIQTVIDAEEAILHNVDAAFHLKLQIDGLKSSFLNMAIKTGAINNDALRVFSLMDSALKLEGMSAWVSVLMSNSRESGLARLKLPRNMQSVESDLSALIDGSEDLEITAETNMDIRKMLEETQIELKSAFINTNSLLEKTQSMREVSEASSRIAKDADNMTALARASRKQLPKS